MISYKCYKFDWSNFYIANAITKDLIVWNQSFCKIFFKIDIESIESVIIMFKNNFKW